MAISSSSIVFYSQAIKQLDDLRTKYVYGTASVDEFMEDFRSAISIFNAVNGSPLTKYDPVADSEPPLSSKYNRFINDLESDVNILQYQNDVLRSASVFAHNLVTTEIHRAKAENARVSNKMKTLQLYSESTDSSIITFGDFFRDEEFLDESLVPSNETAYIPAEGYLILGQEGSVKNLTENSSITITNDSNGFVGNLHELSRDTHTVQTENAVNVGETNGLNSPDTNFVFVQQPVFKAEIDSRASLISISDGAPDTWFEYEGWLVSTTDRAKAKNLGFVYEQTDLDGKTKKVDWANGISNGSLKLGLQFDLLSAQIINYISIIPFNLEDNANHPILVNQIQTSKNGTDWDIVKPTQLFIGTTPNISNALGTDLVLSSGLWAFAGRLARFVRVYIQQGFPIDREMGHIYYVDKNGARVEGPNPPFTNPIKYYDPAHYNFNGLSQKREKFNAKRWVVGLRDISIIQATYAETSSVVTKPLRVGGVVDRISLEANITIPDEYPSDTTWIQFFVSPDEGENWFPIARIQDDLLGIPEIIAFNDPLPEELQESGVAYYQVDGAVKSLRLKIVLSRPTDQSATTPMVHSYKLKVKKR